MHYPQHMEVPQNKKNRIINMKNNPVNRIKLLMSYDSKKTLNENVKDLSLINENDFELDEAPSTGEDIGKLFRNASKETGQFKGVSNAVEKDAKFAQAAGEKLGLGVDEVKEALASERVVQSNIDNAIENQYASGTRVGNGQVVGRDVEQASKQLALRRVIERGREANRVLNANEINAIIKKTEQDTLRRVQQFEKDVKAGRVRNPKTGYTRGSGGKKVSTAAGDVNSAEKSVAAGDVQSAEKSVNITLQQSIGSFNTGADAAKATKDEIKAGGLDANTAAVAEESAKVTETMPPSRWQKWKAWAKRNPNTKNILYLLGFGAGAWALYHYFSKDKKGQETTTDEVKRKTLSDCLGPIFDNNNGTIMTTSGGDPVASIKNFPGYPQYDSLGGLWFFITSGRVMTADKGNTKRGNYSCSGNNVVITWDGEGGSTTDTTSTTGTTTGDTTNTTGTTTGDTTSTTGTTTGDTTSTTGTTTGDTTNAGLASMVKTSDNQPQEVTPEIQQLIDRGKEVYTRLYDNYNTEGKPKPFIKKDGNRLKYKGQKLPGDELNALNQYIKSLGYSYMKQKDKQYIPLERDEKYVWEKNKEPEVQQPETGEQQPETQAQEPTQLSEDFIKKIVSKHLRSKL